jgi:hypothetical protein
MLRVRSQRYGLEHTFNSHVAPIAMGGNRILYPYARPEQRTDGGLIVYATTYEVGVEAGSPPSLPRRRAIH